MLVFLVYHSKLTKVTMTSFTFNNGHGMACCDDKVHLVYVTDSQLIYTIDGVDQPNLTTKPVISACIIPASIGSQGEGTLSIVYTTQDGLWFLFRNRSGNITANYQIIAEEALQPSHRTDDSSVVVTYHRNDGYVYVTEVHGDGAWGTTKLGAGCFASISPSRNVIYYRSERAKAGVWKLIRAERNSNGVWAEVETGITGHDPSVIHEPAGKEWFAFQKMGAIYIYTYIDGKYTQSTKRPGFGWFAHLRVDSIGDIACCWEASSVSDVKNDAAKYIGICYLGEDGLWVQADYTVRLGLVYPTCELDKGTLYVAAVERTTGIIISFSIGVDQ